MDGDIGKQIIIILGLIIANGLFSMTEMSIISARRSRLESMAESGSKGAKVAIKLAEEPNQMLSTVQIGITLIGIITGLYGGAALERPLTAFIIHFFPSVTAYAESISVFSIVTIITYLTLVIGELVPKRLALNNPETLSAILSRPMHIFSLLCKPFVLFLSLSTEALLHLLKVKTKTESPVTEDEIKLMLTQGAEMGAFEKEEPELVDNIFRLADLNAADVMTPRTQLEWIDLNDGEEKIKDILRSTNHIRLLVGADSLDEMQGLVYTSDVFSKKLSSEDVPFKDLIVSCIRTPIIVPESITLMKLLSLLRSEGVHEAVVLDEFGSLSGFVTLHDIMEEIIGLMPAGEEERLEEENRILPHSENSWLVDGLLNIEEFKDYFNIMDDLPDEEEDLYKTVGGLITYLLGRIPKETDAYTWKDYTFQIVDMDNVRVDKVLVTYTPPVIAEFPEE